jgi:hypothetical protein
MTSLEDGLAFLLTHKRAKRPTIKPELWSCIRQKGRKSVDTSKESRRYVTGIGIAMPLLDDERHYPTCHLQPLEQSLFINTLLASKGNFHPTVNQNKKREGMNCFQSQDFPPVT